MERRFYFLVVYVISFFVLANNVNGQTNDLETSMDSIYSSQVVITGSLKELRKEEFAIPIKIYDATYFQRQQITNVQDALRMVTGIQSNIDGALDGSGDIEINGQEGSYTLVLIDGIPISGGNATVYAISGIPMSIVDRIEVMQGPSSTVYGTDAIAGVINIITISPGKAPRFSIQGGTNSYLETNAELAFALKAGKLDGIFAASHFNQAVRWDINKDGYLDLPLQNRFSLFNKWSFKNKVQKQSSFWGRYTHDSRVGGETDWQTKYRKSDYIYGESIKLDRFEVAGNFAMPIQNQDLILSLAYLHQNQRAAYGLNEFNSMEQNLFTQLVYDKKVAKTSELMTGVSYRFYRFLKPSDAAFKNDSNSLYFVNHMPAIFLQDMMHFNKNHELLAGIRFEYTTANKGYAICPRIDYKWQSNNHQHSIRVGVGSGFRTPNLFVDDRIAYTDAKRVVLDDEIKNELAYGGHIQYELKRKVQHIDIGFESRLFTNAIINKIEAELQEDNATFLIENEDNQAWYYGLQNSFSARFPSSLYMQIGATAQFSYLIQKTQITPVINAPALNMTFDIGYQNAQNGWTASVNGWLNSPMLLRRQFNDPRPPYSPWYAWLNLFVEKKWKSNISLRMGVNNVLNLLPKQPIFRGNDPFNYSASDPVSNPNGHRFNTTYLYAPNKGVHGFFTLSYMLP